MKKKRPVNLALSTLSFPPMAIASILHRLSGLLLFIMVPVLLVFFQQSLLSAAAFADVRQCLASHWVRALVWFFLSGLVYHLFAGIRHMIMDLGVGESLLVARRSSIVLMVLSAVVIVYMGGRLW